MTRKMQIQREKGKTKVIREANKSRKEARKQSEESPSSNDRQQHLPGGEPEPRKAMGKINPHYLDSFHGMRETGAKPPRAEKERQSCNPRILEMRLNGSSSWPKCLDFHVASKVLAHQPVSGVAVIVIIPVVIIVVKVFDRIIIRKHNQIAVLPTVPDKTVVLCDFVIFV